MSNPLYHPFLPHELQPGASTNIYTRSVRRVAEDALAEVQPLAPLEERGPVVEGFVKRFAELLAEVKAAESRHFTRDEVPCPCPVFVLACTHTRTHARTHTHMRTHTGRKPFGRDCWAPELPHPSPWPCGYPGWAGPPVPLRAVPEQLLRGSI